ncbi:MAG: FGGY family carbohydrate kinase [Nocardioidaceae bacterium]
MLYAGVDVGTSGLKAAVVDDHGEVVHEAAAGYETAAPHPGWCEIDPERWLLAYERIRTDDSWPADPAAVAFTGQMHGVVVTDEAAVPLYPAILWPDRRAAPIVDRWVTEHATVIDRLDTPASPGYAGPILGWLGEHRPDVLARARHVWFAKDWLRARATGVAAAVSDRSDACASLLWDPVADDWLDDAVRLAGLSRELLPEVRAATEVVGQWGSTSVAVGGADTATALAAYRSLAAPTAPDTVYVNVGTGVQVLRAFDRRPARSVVSERVFADVSGGWYAMHALRRTEVSPDALLDSIVGAVATLGGGDVVVGGGVAHDAAFRAALASRLGRPIRYASPRSLSACGAALLAATSLGHRIGLRQETVEVPSN